MYRQFIFRVAFYWVLFGLANSAMVFADLSVGAWDYSQNGGMYGLLSSENWQDRPINPMQFPTFHETKEASYSSPFFPSWTITTVTSTTFAGRSFPQITSQIESNWNNVQDPRTDAMVGAGMRYQFQAWKKYDWVPNLDVPIKSFMSVEISATRFADAYASSFITYLDSSGSHDVGVDMFSWRDGNGTRSLDRKFVVRLDGINQAVLNTSLQVMGQDANGMGLDGRRQASAIADPQIQIDPEAFIEINGTNYRATELYGLSFSPGFSAVPEPGSAMICGIFASLMGLRRRARPRVIIG